MMIILLDDLIYRTLHVVLFSRANAIVDCFDYYI